VDWQNLYLAPSDNCWASRVKFFMEAGYKHASQLSMKLFISVLTISDMVRISLIRHLAIKACVKLLVKHVLITDIQCDLSNDLCVV
jgi:hypothetical protein